MPRSPSGTPQSENRSTEGSKPSLNHGKGPETTKRRGRPRGSKNKSKSLIPAEIGTQLLEVMKERLPGEHYEYMKGVIVRGEAIATEREVDMLITLVRGSLMPYLAMEALPVPVLDPETLEPEIDEETGKTRMRFPGIDRDVTDRLKLLNSLLSLKDGIEKRKESGTDDEKEQVILKVIAARGIDPSRLAVLAGLQPGSVVGDLDGAGRGALPARTVSGEVAERQEP